MPTSCEYCDWGTSEKPTISTNMAFKGFRESIFGVYGNPVEVPVVDKDRIYILFFSHFFSILSHDHTLP